MRHAVFEHPGIAGRGRDHFIDLVEVEALLGGKRYRFAGGRDVHAGEKLVDHLEGGAGSGRVAEFVDFAGHGVETRAGRVESLLGAGCHDRQFAVCRLGRAARNWRIEVMQTESLHPLCQVACHSRVHGGRRNEDCSGLHRPCDTLDAEQHSLGLRTVDDDGDDNVGILCRTGGRVSAASALGDEAVHRRRSDVIPNDIEACALHRPGHSEPHGAKADDGRDNSGA
ncbi:hypothetical protein D9M72_402080 [compost metagenome]